MSQIFAVNDGDYITLPWGTLVFHNNELHLVSSVADPAGLSFRGHNGSKISWKTTGGEELTLLQLRQTSAGHGEFYFGTVDQDVLRSTGNLDRAMIEVATFNAKQIEFRVPVKFSAGVIGGASGTSDTLWSPSGLWFVQMQDDGNFVKYSTSVPFDKGHVTSAVLIG